MKKNKPVRRTKFILITTLTPLLIVALFIVYKVVGSPAVDTSNPPKFIQADFIDLSRIYTISKFRSLAGHDFSGGGESCRSMKHYFTPQRDKTANEYLQKHNWTPPSPDGKTDIPIYSPVSGKVVKMVDENNSMGKQIFIVPDNATGYTIRLFHIWPNSNLKDGFILGLGGSHVDAGKQIGVIGGYQETDIAVQATDISKGDTYLSYFDVMPEKIFEKYVARGVSSKSDLIISKEYRDSHSVTCESKDHGERFNMPSNYDYENADYVHMSGYVKVNSDGSTSKTAR